jgi:putative transcriptional regulator
MPAARRGVFSPLRFDFAAAARRARHFAARAVDAARGTSVARLRRMPESTRSLIRTLRQQLGMTQEEFAHQIAVTVSTVNRWENSHAEPSKLAWKAIKDLARQRGLPSETGSPSGGSY